jgi:arylsulfatase A-like enzyme
VRGGPIARSLSGPLIALLLLTAAPGCSHLDEAFRGGDGEPPNVILIVLDTVRADHLGCYGYARETSPNIDAFAGTATRHARALSSAPWTVPSHASIFTGKPPFVHGAHTVAVKRQRNNVRPLHRNHLTLAEALAAEGYQTAAFASNAAYLARFWRLDQGFETYHVERAYAKELNERIFDWLERAERPFFLFANYIDAHRPYNTRPRAGFLDPPAVEDDGELVKRLKNQVLPAKRPVPRDLVRRVVDQYDTAIANLDEEVGALLDRLKQRDLYDNAVIVITSDHGEYFGEHLLVEHSKDVYQEAIRVPLLVRAPGQREARTDELLAVSNDLPNLIVSNLSEATRERIASRFPDAPGNHTVVVENYFTRSDDLFHPAWGHRFDRVRRAVFDWPYKLIHSSDGNHELYDLEADPREERNLYAERRDLVERLGIALHELLSERPDPAQEPELDPLDEDLRRQLKALGYLGS